MGKICNVTAEELGSIVNALSRMVFDPLGKTEFHRISLGGVDDEGGRYEEGLAVVCEGREAYFVDPQGDDDYLEVLGVKDKKYTNGKLLAEDLANVILQERALACNELRYISLLPGEGKRESAVLEMSVRPEYKSGFYAEASGEYTVELRGNSAELVDHVLSEASLPAQRRSVKRTGGCAAVLVGMVGVAGALGYGAFELLT